jgi:hypothetical protein
MSRNYYRPWKISTGRHFQNSHHCRESIQDIIIYLHMKFCWNRTMLNLCVIVASILKMATDRNFSMLGINLGHHNLPTYENNHILFYFLTGWLSSFTKPLYWCKLMLTWIFIGCWSEIQGNKHSIGNRTMLNLCELWQPFWKWRPVEFFRCQESIRAIIIYLHMKFCWNRTMLNLSTTFHMWVDYDVPNWFLTSKDVYRSPCSKWPPQYRTNSTLSDFNDISYIGRLWFCAIVSDICRGHVHVARKERRRIIIIKRKILIRKL